MGHLEFLELSNFRVFSKEKIPLSAITVLTGKNSGGKSSLLKAILLFKENIKDNFIPDELDFNISRNVKLGGFSHVVNKGSNSDVMEFSFPLYLVPFEKDRFTVSFAYKNSESSLKDIGRLTSIRIYNEDKEKILFQINAAVDTKNIDKSKIANIEYFNKSVVDKKYCTTYSIDIAYLIDAFRKLRAKLRANQSINPWPPSTDEISCSINDVIFLMSTPSDETVESTDHFYYASLEELMKDEARRNNSLKLDVEAKSKLEGINLKKEITSKEIDIDQLDKIDKWYRSACNYCCCAIWVDPTDISSNGQFYPKDLREILERTFSKVLRYILPRSTEYASLLNYSDEQILEPISPISDILFVETISQGIESLLDKLKAVNSLPPYRAINDRMVHDLEPTDCTMSSLVNKLISTNFPNGLQTPVGVFLTRWIRAFEIGDELRFVRGKEGITTSVHVIRGGHSVNILDLGYGINQFLAILLKVVILTGKSTKYSLNREPFMCFKRDPATLQKVSPPQQLWMPNYMPSIMMIEEPESNLHPKLQGLLADFFFDAALRFSIQFIVETHSEYFIRKLQVLTGKKWLTPEGVKVYYFDKSKKEVARDLKIQKDGVFEEEFGSGFVDESVNLQFELLKIKNQN